MNKTVQYMMSASPPEIADNGKELEITEQETLPYATKFQFS